MSLINNLKKIFKGRIIALTILMIIIFSVTPTNMVVNPFILFTGVITAIMMNDSMKNTMILIIVTFILGALISSIIAIIYLSFIYGIIYAMNILPYYLINIISYVILGCIGGLIGYNINSIKLENKEY